MLSEGQKHGISVLRRGQLHTFSRMRQIAVFINEQTFYVNLKYTRIEVKKYKKIVILLQQRHGKGKKCALRRGQSTIQ